MTNPFQSIIQSASSTYGVPENLLNALIGQESSFNPSAQNGNAYGIAQFMPGTAAQYGVDVTDPNSSINGAAHYLSDLYNQTGSWTSAITRYGTVPSTGPQNAGQANVLNIAQAADVGGDLSKYGPSTDMDNSNIPGYAKTTPAALSGIFTWLEGGVFRVGIGILALLFLAIGLAALALKSHPTTIVKSVVSKGLE